MKAVPKNTIEDVARLSGVSKSTVSRVLNNYSNVKGKTRRLVLEVMQQLNYKPNIHARRFASGCSYTISVFLPEIGTQFYGRILKGVEEELDEYSYDSALFPLLIRERLKRFSNPQATAYQSDGFLFVSLDPEKLYHLSPFPLSKPVALTDGYSDKFDCVYVDNRLGGYLAGQYLSSFPGELFIIMTKGFEFPFNTRVFRERLTGFKTALKEKGLDLPQRNIISVDLSLGGGQIAARDILQVARPPLNIFATCDLLALGVIEEIRRAGLSLKDEVRIIGFDDQPWAKDYGITTLHQPIEEMGKMAARFLMERIKGYRGVTRAISYKPKLIKRSSA